MAKQATLIFRWEETKICKEREIVEEMMDTNLHIHKSFQRDRGPKHPVHSGSGSYARLSFTGNTFQKKTSFCTRSDFTAQSE